LKTDYGRRKNHKKRGKKKKKNYGMCGLGERVDTRKVRSSKKSFVEIKNNQGRGEGQPEKGSGHPQIGGEPLMPKLLGKKVCHQGRQTYGGTEKIRRGRLLRGETQSNPRLEGAGGNDQQRPRKKKKKKNCSDRFWEGMTKMERSKNTNEKKKQETLDRAKKKAATDTINGKEGSQEPRRTSSTYVNTANLVRKGGCGREG